MLDTFIVAAFFRKCILPRGLAKESPLSKQNNKYIYRERDKENRVFGSHGLYNGVEHFRMRNRFNNHTRGGFDFGLIKSSPIISWFQTNNQIN